ncbi:TldE/PmbA family protein, beta/gamma-proteobacterial subgroup [Methyloglobulus morosus KoM1]|uniref:TldE/PmbA family protein, beta/gamma-proteobacterial subgroup n=1 Tax=Methyloglobulus morosus KoM1 TaxID=1116472 RepID=V5C7L9_9GAMM|nr:metallopeptidase TldD-related protein [Methyloglobulus morosus]ESS72733.1 TldE/PmbA family protein, beta/gamma-proteobacterial subgroup [Methyloglobulus morosus KoM1]
MQNYFYELAAFLQNQVKGNERFTCWFSAEDSDFVRFNHGAIRQPGHVSQIYLNLQLISGQRHAGSSATLGGSLDPDNEILERLVCGLRSQLADLSDDPHLLISTEVCSTEHIVASRLPATHVVVDEILAVAKSYDFVGILAAGPVYRGFANSYGQRNWHETSSFNLDWSLYCSDDKAVKSAYAGFDWDSAAFKVKFNAAVSQLDILKRDPITLKLGGHRAYLSPTAFGELVGMLNWDGLSEKSLRTRQSALRKMRDGGLQLNPAITLCENVAEGIAPSFQREGFIKPGSITLIDHGHLSNSMVSPRTAKEFGIATNGADGSEMMVSVDVQAGALPLSQVLSELDTGVYISNLWYLNYSDRANCRITGMTRFATFWVENGEIKAPINATRFDDSLFQLLGEKLAGLTCERELLINSESYGQRGINSMRLPGALVKEFVFVL